MCHQYRSNAHSLVVLGVFNADNRTHLYESVYVYLMKIFGKNVSYINYTEKAFLPCAFSGEPRGRAFDKKQHRKSVIKQLKTMDENSTIEWM